MTLYSWKQRPLSVATQLQRLSDTVESILKKQYIGLYVHGSLALDQFNPKISDIDVIVVVNDMIGNKERHRLLEALLLLSKQPHPIEISFMSLASLQNYSYPPAFELHYSEAWRERLTEAFQHQTLSPWESSYTDSDLASYIKVLNQSGIRLYGPEIDSIFPTISDEHFLQSIESDGRITVEQLIDNPVYVILSPWRVIAYKETKQILSKVQAGYYALQHIENQFEPLIKQALLQYEQADDVTTVFDKTLLLNNKLLQDYIRMLEQHITTNKKLEYVNDEM